VVGRTTAGGYGREWPPTDGDRAWYLDQYAPDEVTLTDPDVAPLGVVANAIRNVPA
jgi:hypothetical protein